MWNMRSMQEVRILWAQFASASTRKPISIRHGQFIQFVMELLHAVLLISLAFAWPASIRLEVHLMLLMFELISVHLSEPLLTIHGVLCLLSFGLGGCDTTKT